MKYKIQNHFAHNDAQVFLPQKCISVFFFPYGKVEKVKQRTIKKKNTHTHKATAVEAAPTTTYHKVFISQRD